MNLRVEDIFDAARRLTDSARRAFLDAACGDDLQLRQELEELLALQTDAQALLDPGAAGFHPEAGKLHELPPVLIGSVALQERIGDRVGRYRLREKIGEGGCGIVYVADQEEPVRRRVALKVIKLGMDTKSVIARFEAERQALAIMDHPNIAKVLDAGSTQTGRPYFVMELVRGVRITEFCDQNRLTTQQRLDLFILVCHAVQHAHQKGIIHRDLKPSNILVSVNDGVAVPKIIDFGIAKATEGRLTDCTVYTELNQLIGTPAYMSPEQALMTSLDIDTRSDVYSLGVLLYELLTGTTPFESRELLKLGLDEMRRTIREKAPLRPSTRLERLPYLQLDTTAKARGMEAPRLCLLVRGDLDWIVMKCLEKDRGRRYSTVNDLAADLKRHLNNEPVVARPPSKIYEFQKTVLRHKVGFAAMMVVIATLTASALLTKRAEREVLRLLRQSEAETYAADMSTAKQAWDEGDLRRAQALLDAHLPKPGQPDLRNFDWRCLWKLVHINSLIVIESPADDPVKLLATSPAHQAVVVCCDKTIRLLDPVTGHELLHFSIPDADAVKPVFAMALASGATNLLAIHRAGGAVTLWDLKNQTQLMSFQAPSNKFTTEPYSEAQKFLALSPDGKLLACASPGASSAKLVVWETSFARQRPSAVLWDREVTNGVMSMSFTPDGGTLITAESFRGRAVCTWDARTGAPGKPFPILSTGNIYALAVSPDGSMVAHAGVESRIQVLDFATRTWKCTFEGHSGLVESLAFSADGNRLVSGGADGTVRIWDIPSRKNVGIWRDPDTIAIHSVAFVPDGSSIFSASSKAVRMWSADPHALDLTIKTGQEIGALEISPDGKWLVTTDASISDGSAARPAAKVWDMSTRQQKFYLADKSRHPVRLAFGLHGDLLALGDLEKEGVVGLWNTTSWNTATGRVEPFAYLTNGFEAGSLCFSQDGKLLAVAGVEYVSNHPSHATNRLAFYEVGSWKRLTLLPGAGAGSNEWAAAATVDFSSDGRLVAVGHRDGWVRLWNLKQQRLVKEFPAHENFEFGGAVVQFSRDSRWLVSIMRARQGLALFDLADPEHPCQVLTDSETGSFWWASFTPDNKNLVTINNDGVIQFSNLQTRRVTLTLRQNHGPTAKGAFAPGGNLLVTSDGADVLSFWPVPSLAEIDANGQTR